LGSSILECCQVKLSSRGDIPFASLLSDKKSREVMELVAGDRACIKMDLKENGVKNIKLIRKDEGQLVFVYEKGVQCMTCGEKMASQDVWNKNHYPRCKSLVPNIEESEVKATLIWPSANIERSIPGQLRFGKELLNEIFTLYNEYTDNVEKLMEGLIQDGQNLEKVTQALFSKEKHIFNELSQLAQKE
jgi:predicted Zn-ribbon and HTH transcriptional regulator